MKHLAGVEAGYFGAVFDRPFDEDLPWATLDAAPEQDMWAARDESSDEIIALYRLVLADVNVTIDGLPTEVTRHVPWWFEAINVVTLGCIPGSLSLVQKITDIGAALRKPE